MAAEIYNFMEAFRDKMLYVYASTCVDSFQRGACLPAPKHHMAMHGYDDRTCRYLELVCRMEGIYDAFMDCVRDPSEQKFLRIPVSDVYAIKRAFDVCMLHLPDTEANEK